MPIASLARVLVDGYDLSSRSTSVEVNTDVTTLEWSTLDSLATNMLPDVPKSAIMHNGYFTTPNAGELERAFWDNLGSTANDILVTAVLGTQGAIIPSYTLATAFADKLTVKAVAKSLVTAEGNWQSGAASAPMRRGYQLYSGTISATGAKTHVDFSSAGSAGGVAYIHVTAVSGTATGADVAVQCDDNTSFTSATTLGTLTFSGNSTTGLQSLSVSLGSGAVDRYLRISCTDLGGATSFYVSVFACVAGVTY